VQQALLFIASLHFRGKPIVKQHQAVADILKEDIAKWHGMRLSTKACEPQQ